MTDIATIPTIAGLSFEDLPNGITIGKVTSSTPQVIDVFVETVKARQKDWEPTRVAYYLWDFSESFAGFNTPYGRARMSELAQWRPEIVSYSAVLIQKTFIMQLGSIFINNIASKRQGSYNRLFFTRAEAMAWLEKRMEQNKAAKPAST